MGCDLQFAKFSVVCKLEAVGSADTSLWLVSASPAFFLTGVCIFPVLMTPLRGLGGTSAIIFPLSLVSNHQPTQPHLSVPSISTQVAPT